MSSSAGSTGSSGASAAMAAAFLLDAMAVPESTKAGNLRRSRASPVADLGEPRESWKQNQRSRISDSRSQPKLVALYAALRNRYGKKKR